MDVVKEAVLISLLGVVAGLMSVALRGVPRAEAPPESASCAPPSSTQGFVRWVTVEDAQGLLNDPAIRFADARSPSEYEAGHILGALNVPMDKDMVSEARPVITYCDTQSGCARSARLTHLLQAAGIGDVRVLKGGMPEWNRQGRPAEAGPCRECP